MSMSHNTQVPTKLLEALHVAELSAAEQETLLLDLNELILESTLTKMLDGMDEPTKAKFIALMEGEPEESSVEAFIAQNVPNADALVAEAVQEITDDILAVTGTNK